MAPTSQTSKAYFTFLSILHGAMLIIQVIFGVLAYFLKSTGAFEDTGQELAPILKITTLVLVAGGLAASLLVSKTQLKSLKQKPELKDKLYGYRSVLLMKLALLEVPAMFAIISFLLTSSYFFLGIAGSVLVLFYIYRPTLERVVMDLELSLADKNVLEDPKSVIG